MGEGPKRRRTKAGNVEGEASRMLARLLPGLWAVLSDRARGYVFQSVSLRRRSYADWICVVSSLAEDEFCYVVAFGSGTDAATAVRNASLAIGKGQWKRDKFRSVQP